MPDRLGRPPIADIAPGILGIAWPYAAPAAREPSTRDSSARRDIGGSFGTSRTRNHDLPQTCRAQWVETPSPSGAVTAKRKSARRIAPAGTLRPSTGVVR